jgi:polysaccharide export outer membrane protein
MRLFCVAFFGLAVVAFVGCSEPIKERLIKLSGTAATTSGNYRINPGDIIRMDVFQEPDMQNEQKVAADGSLDLPLIGRVVLGNLTLDQASAAITAKLRGGYLVNPQVTLNVVEYFPRRFSVLGQVNLPGAFTIPGEEVMTLPTAIAMAGGNTRIGNLHSVLVTRRTNEGIKETTVNVFTTAGRQFVIEKGDIVMIPENLL